MTLPDTLARAQQEQTLQTNLGTILMTKSPGAPEVEAAFTRVRELCEQAGETPEGFPALWGLWFVYFARAQHQAARELAEQCLSLADDSRDPSLLLEAHYALGISLFFLGEFLQARKHFAQSLALYDPAQHHRLTLLLVTPLATSD